MSAPTDRLTAFLLRVRPTFRHRVNEDGHLVSTLPADQTLLLTEVIQCEETERGLLVTTLQGRYLFTNQTFPGDHPQDLEATTADIREALAVLLVQHGAPRQTAIPLASDLLSAVKRLSQACKQGGIRDQAALALDLLAFFQPRP